MILPPAQTQLLPQTGGGDVHDAGQDQRDALRPEPLLEKGALDGEQLLGVLLAAPEGTEGTPLRDLAGVPPQMEGQEHVRPHQQIELRLGVLLPDGPDGVQGVALALPAQLHVRRLRLGPQGLGCQVRHGQPEVRRRRPGVHGLVGRDARRDQQQLVQPQVFQGEPRRLHVAQMDGIEGPAIDPDLHGNPSLLRRTRLTSPAASEAGPSPARSSSCPCRSAGGRGRTWCR